MANLFFWAKWIDKIVLGALWWVIIMAIILWVPFMRPWWWIFLPICLSIELRKLYAWWISWDYAYAKTKWVVLEMIPPKEILTPLKAMEDVFGVLWATVSDKANWREKMFEGRLGDAPDWMSLEIVSVEGKLHFYARILQAHRSVFESTLYNHYPELEIHEAPDYTKDVPQNIPNQEWDVYGEDFILRQEAALPIKTYEHFFEPQGEKITAEEKRIDPLNSLLESMARLGKGEQFWLQYILSGTSDASEPGFKEMANALIEKIKKRPFKKKTGFMDEVLVAINNIIFGPQKVGSGEKATYKWLEAGKTESGESEMVLTPGEREKLQMIENKLRKPLFRTTIRGLYVAKRENWKASHRILTRAYFAHFHTSHLNSIGFYPPTRPKT